MMFPSARPQQDADRPAGSGGPIQFVFLANRTDGLGQRLKAMIHAIALAEQFNGRFCFEWKDRSARQREFHATESMESCFSDDFITRHALAQTDVIAGLHAISFGEFLKNWHAEAEAAQEGTSPSGPEPDDRQVVVVIAPTTTPGPGAAWLRRNRPAGALAQAFGRIGFSDNNAQAIAAARDLPLPAQVTALHLRAGDVLYGTFRFMDRFMDKVLPSQVAEALLDDLDSKAITTLIFGQDAALCRALAAAGPHRILASDLTPTHCASPTQKALFEIVLMARTGRIICGHSGFPEIAAIIGQVATTDIAHVFGPKRRAAIILKGGSTALAAATSPQQKAFSLFYVAHHLLQDPARDSTAIGILEQALALTPDNGFYSFLRAALLYRSGQDTAAEAALATLLPQEGEGSLHFVLTDQNRPAQAYLPLLLPAARRGLPMASLCVVIAARIKTDDLAQACIPQALQADLPTAWITRLESARSGIQFDPRRSAPASSGSDLG